MGQMTLGQCGAESRSMTSCMHRAGGVDMASGWQAGHVV